MAFGFSGVALSSAITKYRILFLIIAFSLLALAFYLAYKPAKLKNEGVQERSTPNKKKTFNFKKLNRVMLWIVAAFTIAFAFLPKYIHLFTFNQKKVETEQPSCPAAIQDKNLSVEKEKDEQNVKSCNPSKE